MGPKISAVIIEDEYKVRKVFISLLEKFCPEINIMGEAENITKGYELIMNAKPELVFLDIEMSGGNGFELLAMFDEPFFETIFVTSYGHYAIKAIKYSALDYMLKPVMIEDVKQITARYRSKNNMRHYAGQYKLLKENLLNGPNDQKLAITTKTKLEFINMSDIIYLKADGNYTTIVLNNDVKYYIAKTLKEYEGILCQQASDFFVRIHKAYIVNVFFIKHIERGEDYSLVLHDDTRLEISRRKRQELLNRLSSGSSVSNDD